jgi:hypothetical protein
VTRRGAVGGCAAVQRQGADTIISWLDLEVGTDLAISFQEAIGCNYIWEQIQNVQTQYRADKDEGKGPVSDSVAATAPGDAAGSKGGGGGGGGGAQSSPPMHGCACA